MKAVYVVCVVSAVLGAALGAGLSWASFGNAPALIVDELPDGANESSATTRPKVLVDSLSHDFGPVERDHAVRHAFRFTNIGDAPLTLKAGTTTCTQCTISHLVKPVLAPGESSEVVVEYVASASKPKFQQMAPILTNDPEQHRVELYIVGTVTMRYRVVPEQVLLGKVSANETKTTDIKILAFFADEVRLVSHGLQFAATAPYFEVTSEPIPREQLIEEGAKSGLRVILTLKPGLPLGPIGQTIRLEFELGHDPQTTVMELGIAGEVDSDISVVGPGWNQEHARLSFGAVKSDRGATRKLFVLVRGEHRGDVEIKTAKIEPSWLKVTVGEPSQLGSGAVTQIPLTIEIPPGLPPVNHLGSQQGKYAEIVLKTNHPQVKQIQLFLSFAIEP